MLIFWLVMSGRWDVFGTPDDLDPRLFIGSAVLCASELAAEAFWLLWVLS